MEILVLMYIFCKFLCICGKNNLVYLNKLTLYTVALVFSEALPALSHFQMRQVRPTPWKVQLEITSNIRIPVCSYIKVSIFFQVILLKCNNLS